MKGTVLTETVGLTVKNDLDSLLVAVSSLTSFELEYNLTIRVRNCHIEPDQNKKMTDTLEKKLKLSDQNYCWKFFPFAGTGIQRIYFLMYIHKGAPTKFIKTNFLDYIVKEAGKKMPEHSQTRRTNLGHFYTLDARKLLVVYQSDWRAFAELVDENLRSSSFLKDNQISFSCFYGKSLGSS